MTNFDFSFRHIIDDTPVLSLVVVLLSLTRDRLSSLGFCSFSGRTILVVFTVGVMATSTTTSLISRFSSPAGQLALWPSHFAGDFFDLRRILGFRVAVDDLSPRVFTLARRESAGDLERDALVLTWLPCSTRSPCPSLVASAAALLRPWVVLSTRSLSKELLAAFGMLLALSVR